MANTLGGLSLTVIAEKALATLLATPPLLSAFTTDFSSDVAQAGGAVSTRIATAFTTNNTTGGYTPANSVSTAVTVTLSNHKDVTVAFTDSELASMTESKLTNTFIRPMIHAVVNDVALAACALVTTGNYTAALTTGVASFTADHMADLAEDLSTAKAGPDRAFVCLPTYYAALAKDNSIQAAYAYGGSEAIREGKVPRVHGFDVYQYADLPNNSQNLAAFACEKSAIAIATRVPAIPADFPGEIENITDSDSGLTIQLRKWYDANAGALKLAGTIIYGVAKGNGAALVRVASA